MKNNHFSAVVARFGWLRAASLFALVLFAGTLAASAQVTTVTTGNGRIVHKIVKQHTNPPELGRDFWFAPIQNYLDESGKYYRIYITSPNQTIAHVQSGGIDKAVPVPSYGIGSFNVPLGWEMKSSGVPEDKAIHVYDKTDDICVYLMSHNPYTSDGARIIPTTGWGDDYVVAGYASLFEGFGTYVYDFPSEFTISADQDNTVVDITPSTDLRNAGIYPQNNTVVAYPRGQKFEVTLMRGQAVQYQAVKAQDADNYDVTGTVIHSNVGVDIMAGSACPNIPLDFPYCDQVCDQIPPTRAWAETYYTTNPIQPQGMSGHDFSLYCLISSVPNQEIDRQDDKTGKHVEAVLGPTYDHYYVEEESANKWSSNSPFLLVQYLNSSTYPDNVNGNGDPAECCVTPQENFTKDVVFETPTSVGAQAPYDNYANVIVNIKDEPNVTFDNKKITANTHQPIDGKYEVFIVPHITPAAHVVKSDSGVGVYIYGYGYDESYMWGGGFGNGTFHSPDTISPLASITGQCFEADVHLSDSGYLPGVVPPTWQSKLNEVKLDSDVNMAYQPTQYPGWVDGGGFDSTYYGMYVVDPTKPAILVVDIYDAAGNETMITSTYVPQVADIVPPLQNFGVVSTGTSPVDLYDTIYNQGQKPFSFTQLSLLYGDRGFSLDSTYAFPVTIPVNGYSLIKLKFYPVQLTVAVDSVIFGDPCVSQEVAVIGSGGAPDFYVSDVVWQNVPLHPIPATNWTIKGAVIHNLSKIGPINVSPDFFAPGWPDSTLFVLMAGQPPFPRTIQAGQTDTVWYMFEPVDLNRDTAQMQWTAPEVLATDGSGKPQVKLDKLIGNAITPTLTFGTDTTITIDCPAPDIDTIHLVFTLTNSGTQGAVVNRVQLTNPAQFVNLTGHDQSNGTWDPTTTAKQMQAGATFTFTVDFPVTPATNESGTMEIFAIDGNNDTIQGGRIRATINLNYRSATVSPTTIPFGTHAYKDPIVTDHFTMTNPQSSNLTIKAVNFIAAGKYNSSYKFVNLTDPNTNAFLSDLSKPFTLLAAQAVNVNISFDPSVSFDTVQNTVAQVDADWCVSTDVNLEARVTVSGAAAQSYGTPAAILACGNQVNNVQIMNHQPITTGAAGEDVFLTVASATWIMNNGKNFSVPNLVGDIVHGYGTLSIPVTFTPDQVPQANQTYNDLLHVVLNGAWGWDTTVDIPVTGIATSFTITANSSVASGSNGTATNAGGQLNMPIMLNVNKNGLNTVPLTTLGVTEIDFVYNVPNPGLITPQQPDASSLPAGWTIVPGSWNWDPKTGQLTFKMTGPALDDNVTTLGTIPITVYLDPSDNGTDIQLQSMTLLANGQPLGPCVSTSVQSGALSLILRCGDSTLRLVMSGKGNQVNFTNPATPDPVTGGHVTFQYANRGATNITLTIMDVLGHEVLRPIDNVYHDAGAWQTTTDVSKLPSGTYTYRISAGKDVVSKQFVVQR